MNQFAVLGRRLIAHIDLHLHRIAAVLWQIHGDGDGAVGQSGADAELDSASFVHFRACFQTLPDDGAALLVAFHQLDVRSIAGKAIAADLSQHLVDIHPLKRRDDDRLRLRPLADDQHHRIAFFQGLPRFRLRADHMIRLDLI